jgi:recombination protein RecR
VLSPAITQLIDRLTCLPGVGRKTAQRMSLYLLERNRQGGLALAEALQHALTVVGNCKSCRNLTEQEQCRICSDLRRDKTQLCIVENPSDVIAVEQSGSFTGQYFVLMGHLSPLDGIGPEDLGIPLLLERVRQGVIEVILATNPTVEGEATANYLAEKLKALGVQVSRIAHGVPMGGELEYIDGGTLAHALNSRQKV